MKKIYLLIYLTFISVFAFSQWTVQTSNTTDNLRSVYFLNADTGYVVGSN